MREMVHRQLWLLAVVFLGHVICMFTEGVVLEEVSTDRIRPDATVKVSLQSLSEMAGLGPRSGFRHFNDKVHKSSKGVKHVRLIQTYGGYDVMGSSVVAELDTTDTFSGQMYGKVVRNINKHIPDPEACQYDVEKLLNMVKELKGFNTSDPAILKQDGHRFIYAVAGTSKAILAYKIKFFYNKDNHITYPVYIFDACTGHVLTTYDNLMTLVAETFASNSEHSDQPSRVDTSLKFVKEAANSCPVSAAGVGGNEKMGKRTYNEAPYCLNVKKVGDVCRMEGTVTNAVDNKESGDRNNNNIAEFICDQGYPDKEVNGGYGSVNDVFYGGENLGNLFTVEYGMGFLSYTPRLVAHYGSLYENAFFDGVDTYYGDGLSTFYPLVSTDVVAHELGHGITEENSGLIYDGMSGGMNEAFSDITGVTTDTFAKNAKDTEWTVGIDIFKGDGGLRYMDDPPRDGKSIKSVDDYHSGLNVHYSSGVFNFAYYNLVVTEEMDIYEAYKCFLDANLKLWKPDTDFYSGSCNVMQAAYENGFDHEKVKRAFAKTDLDLDSCKLSALTTTIFAGETREEILVSASRSPILKLELNQSGSNAALVEVIANDKSKVKLVVAKDDEASKVLASGDNVVKFDTAKTHVYVKLMSNSRVDVPVKLHVKAI